MHSGERSSSETPTTRKTASKQTATSNNRRFRHTPKLPYPGYDSPQTGNKCPCNKACKYLDTTQRKSIRPGTDIETHVQIVISPGNSTQIHRSRSPTIGAGIDVRQHCRVLAEIPRRREENRPATENCKRLDTTQRITERTAVRIETNVRTVAAEPDSTEIRRHRRPAVSFGTDTR